ncbi:hypothetical protein ABZ322_43610, partial [Streptomyces sp. NPDC006129]
SVLRVRVVCGWSRPRGGAAISHDGESLGALAPVEPPVRFGSGSTPRSPCVVRVTTRVAVEQGRSTTTGAAS